MLKVVFKYLFWKPWKWASQWVKFENGTITNQEECVAEKVCESGCMGTEIVWSDEVALENLDKWWAPARGSLKHLYYFLTCAELGSPANFRWLGGRGVYPSV